MTVVAEFTWFLSVFISLSILVVKVTELKSLANHVVVGSVSCEMLDLFCPLPQTLAVDINDLGTVKLNLEVTWRYLNLQRTHLSWPLSLFIFCLFYVLSCFFFFSPFDKDDQTSCTSTVSKRLLSNQSPPDTPSMREQVFYVSHDKDNKHLQHPSHLLLHHRGRFHKERLPSAVFYIFCVYSNFLTK